MLLGQFTYTACQAPGPYSSTPGWKVKQVEAEQAGVQIPAAAVQAAVRPFGTFTAPAVPALATQVDIDQLPRCLRLDLLDGAYRSIAHLAAAGRDHSGRDAFFAHGLLVTVHPLADPLPISEGAAAGWGMLRPADLWGAEGWLTPYRADAIEDAVVSGPPRPSAASPLNPERREDFVDLHPGQREFVLAGAERALVGGTPLVIVGLPVEAAMWTSLITHLLLPSAGWMVTFSTYEAGAGPDALGPGFPRIAGVPVEEAAVWRSVPGEQAVVHDPLLPPRRESGGFRLPDGSVLPVGSWATLAEAVCSAGWENDVRAAVDRLGGRLEPDFELRPLVGLPLAVLAQPPDTLTVRPEIAALAVQVAVEWLPTPSASHPAVLIDLVDVIFHWSPVATDIAQRMLGELDTGSETTGAFIDRLLDAYLRTLLSTQTAIASSRPPWLPQRLQLSRPVADRLLTDLDDLISWVDDIQHPIPRSRLILTVAALAERIGWLHAPDRTTIERIVGDRARSAVVPLLLGDRVQLGEQSLPRIPSWLWQDVIVDALQDLLPDHEPGSVLTDPHVRRVVDEAAGPLPAAFVARETLASLTMVDGERAAALLLAPDQREVRGMTAAQLEVLRLAAFLRSTVTAAGRLQVSPSTLFDALRRWVPEMQPRAVVLLDLIDQFDGSVPISDLCAFTVDVLDSLPPDGTTKAIVETLRLAGASGAELRNNAAEWHEQFARPIPLTSRHVDAQSMPLNKPDYPETRLLGMVVGDQLGPGLAAAGLTRLARWILVLAAEALDLPGDAVAMERADWLVSAEINPLRRRLEKQYPSAAKALIGETHAERRRATVAGDVLAAEWVVRAQLAATGVKGDPAVSFFGGQPARGTGWSDGVRALLQVETRSREELTGWIRRVERLAEEAARVAQLPRTPDDRRQVLIGAAVDAATRIAALPGLMGRLRRAPGHRD